MKLQSLNATFIRYEPKVMTWTRVKPEVFTRNPLGPHRDDELDEVTGLRECYTIGVTLQEADGVMFLCPKCFTSNGGAMGTHTVVCWFVGKVGDEVEPKLGRWTPTGTGLADLTFVPSPGRSNSVLLQGEDGCKWYGFVANGDAT